MDAHELILSWPGIAGLEPSAVLEHPAWRLETEYDGSAAELVLDSSAGTEGLRLDITLDDEPRVLVIADSAAYADLHALWSRLGELPDALVVALVEKECGALLQTIENVMRKELRLAGLRPERKPLPALRGFSLAAAGGRYGFSMDIPASAVRELGVLDNLDVGHESIRSLEREARVQYGAVELEAGAAASLKVGDAVVFVPEPVWMWEEPEIGTVPVLSSETTPLSFASIADDDLPPIPEADRLVFAGRAGHVGRVGQASAMIIEN